MARVFVSYRRADGLFGVGWLTERLRSLDSITGVETAFHDAELRAGDDFHDALDGQVAGSDIVIAVIGDRWRGERDDGTARIRDPDDWVVREIAAAFRLNTRVVPILMGGAEHPPASQVHESIEDLARLHALPFSDGRDLDLIVEHVESHLTDIDRERAKRAGLERPVDVPELEHQGLIVLAAAAAALIGAFVAWLIAAYDTCRGSACAFQTSPGYTWYEVIMTIFGAYAGVTAVVGTVLAIRLHRIASHDWPKAFGLVAFVSAMLVLLTVSSRSGHYALAEAPSMHLPRVRFWANVGLVAAGAIVAAGIVSALFSRPRAEPHQIAERVRALGIARDAERWGAVLLSVEFALLSAIGAAVLAALDQSNVADTVNPLPNVSFALVFSVVLLIAHTGATMRLDEQQVDIERELADLPPRYRANAEPRLIAPAIGGGSWQFRTILALPLITAVVAALVDTVL